MGNMCNKGDDINPVKPQVTLEQKKPSCYEISKNGFIFAVVHNSNKVGIIGQMDKYYVPLRDGSEYGIYLSNENKTKCDISVTIDGKSIGNWRLEAYSQASIDRPVDIARRLVFCKVDSSINEVNNNIDEMFVNGQIEVTFTPEIYKTNASASVPVPYGAYDANLSFDGKGMYTPDLGAGYEGGSTKLGNVSSQVYDTRVQFITDVDANKITTMSVRLIAQK